MGLLRDLYCESGARGARREDDIAVVGVDDRANDRGAKASAASFAEGYKGFEEPALNFLRDARAVVGDAEVDYVAFVDGADDYFSRLLRLMDRFDCIGDEVL